MTLWKRLGEDPKGSEGNVEVTTQATIEPGTATVLLEHQGEGSVSVIRLEVEGFQRRLLHDLWLRLTWDDQGTPAVLAPLGAFFGNEMGHRPTR